MGKKQKLTFSESRTVQHDAPSISQLFDQFNANPQIAQEGYLDDDIKNIGKYHRRFVSLEDLHELKQYNKSLAKSIEARTKEIKAQIAEEEAKTQARKQATQETPEES